ncbi:uncharacterized protein LOC117644452 isoform X1 [Thrips palmi]|uniref:Uncharacterized protein LOC117644452 isoform X1 n=1 Tax=Thrips palmi TaxID=161013 RepID=A0A6P8ZM21_THRPL|nr:uncharacterized protein LOC117644452 isoform X1 [Thrips palmi]
MNAKIILAAIAAVCCVQGIAGASLDARRLPSWNEVDVSEFADMDFEDAAEQIMMMVDQLEEETGMDLDLDVHPLKQQRAVKNVFTCATSILNVSSSQCCHTSGRKLPRCNPFTLVNRRRDFSTAKGGNVGSCQAVKEVTRAFLMQLGKTLNQVVKLFAEFHNEKVAYKAAKAACTATPSFLYDDAPATPAPDAPDTPAPDAPDTPAPAPDASACLADAETAYKAAVKASKGKIPGTAIKTLTSVIALKSCFSLI